MKGLSDRFRKEALVMKEVVDPFARIRALLVEDDSDDSRLLKFGFPSDQATLFEIENLKNPPDLLSRDAFASFLPDPGLSDHRGERLRWLLNVVGGLNTKILSEGVENHEDLEMLKDLGGYYGQGFLLGKPALKK